MRDSGVEYYQRAFDPEIEDVCNVLLTTVAVYENTPTEALPTLSETVDPDALSTFLEPRADDCESSYRSVLFTYAGYEVDIDSRGILTLAATQTPQE